jgi:uncharacterized protein (TIGR02001 family)
MSGRRWLGVWAAAGVLAAMPAVARAAKEEYVGAAPELAAETEAEDADFSLSLDVTWASKYVWRGIAVTDDPVVQPSVTASWGGLSLNVWANLDTTDVNDFEGQFLEVDYTLGYSWTWGDFAFSVGAIHYQFPQAHAFDTTEVYAAVGLDVPTSPTLAVYQDVDEADGTYITLSFRHTFEDVWKPSESVAVSVDVGASVAWGSGKHNAFYYGSTGSGWADATVSLGLPIAIGEHVTVTPAVNYSWILDDGISSSLGADDHFWAGVTLTFAF